MPAFIDLGTTVCSDTWSGIPGITITVNSATPTSSLSSVSMAFRSDRTEATPDLLLTSPSSGITITSAQSWSFSVDSRVLTLASNTYYWDITTIALSGRTNTYLNGQILVLNGVDEDE